MGYGEDRLCWKLDNQKVFEVWLLYRVLAPCVGTFPWKSIWRVKIPPQVAFFIWTASLRRILTADNLRRWSIILVNSKRVLDLLACWQGWLGWHRNWVIWRAVLHCVMWCLWRERNARTFEGSERNILDLKPLIFRTLFDWMSTTGLFRFSIFLDLFDYCTLRS